MRAFNCFVELKEISLPPTLTHMASLGTRTLLPFIFLFCWACHLHAELKTRHVFLVSTDGLRWQEVFQGAEKRFLTKQGGVKDPDQLTKQFWRKDPNERRKALLPFLWSVVSKEGQIFGNRELGSVVRVSNGLNFSYPGYNEMLTGRPDSRIDSNDKNNNPNVTVLEWVNQKPEFSGRVAAFGTWDVFPFILNVDRSGIPMQAGWAKPIVKNRTERVLLLEELYETTTPIWENVCLDSMMFHSVAEYLMEEKPRAAFISFGETDEWAHEGRYDQYLRSAHAFDHYLHRLWNFFQTEPFYKDQTTLIISTDHGRGTGFDGWRRHGKETAGSEQMWLAVIGPDTPPLGDRKGGAEVTQSQIAATFAAFLSLDFPAAFPGASFKIEDLFANSSPAGH